MSEKAEKRAFTMGLLHGAWMLNARGDDTQAAELVEAGGTVDQMQRLARSEGYAFRCGFWSHLRHRASFRMNRKAVSR